VKSIALLLLTSIFAAGCAVGPSYKRPAVTVPEMTRGQVGPAEAASLADQPWWEIFGDDSLKALIDEALRNNYDVRAAAWRSSTPSSYPTVQQLLTLATGARSA